MTDDIIIITTDTKCIVSFTTNNVLKHVHSCRRIHLFIRFSAVLLYAVSIATVKEEY